VILLIGTNDLAAHRSPELTADGYSSQSRGVPLTSARRQNSAAGLVAEGGLRRCSAPPGSRAGEIGLSATARMVSASFTLISATCCSTATGGSAVRSLSLEPPAMPGMLRKIRGFRAAVIKVRIHLPPAESRTNFRFLSGGVPSAVWTRYWASCHSGLMFGGPSRTRAEAVVGALRFAEPIDSNAPLTVPLASYQTAKSPDNDRFESERCRDHTGSGQLWPKWTGLHVRARPLPTLRTRQGLPMVILRSPSTIQAGGRRDRSDMPLGSSVGIASTTASLASILWC